MATEHIGGAFSAELPWMQLRACAGLGSASFDSFPASAALTQNREIATTGDSV